MSDIFYTDSASFQIFEVTNTATINNIAVNGSLTTNGAEGNINTSTAILSNRYSINTIRWGDYYLQDSTNAPSIDWNNYQLIDTSNHVIKINWSGNTIKDNSDRISIDWENRELNEAVSPTLKWGQYILYDPINGNDSLNWSTRKMKSGLTGYTAIDWESRILYDDQTSNEANVVLDFKDSTVSNGIRLYGTSSYALTASYALNSTTIDTSSFVQNSQTSSMLAPYVLNSSTSSFVTNSQTSSFVKNSQTSSMLAPYVLNSSTSSFVTNSQTSSFVTNNQTSSFVLNSQTSSMTVATASYVTGSIFTSTNRVLSASNALTASFVNTLNQNVTITGSLIIGTGSAGSTENTLILGPAPAGGNGEGGQILLQAPNSGGYTSASMIDNYQNLTRLLRGTNASSDAVVASWNMDTKQAQLPSYNSSTAFLGTSVATLNVDSNGNILTTQISSPNISLLSALGSVIKSEQVISTQQFSGTTLALAANRFIVAPVYVPQRSTITGAKWFQVNTGSYTPGNYCGLALYTISNGNLTCVASSSNVNTWSSSYTPTNNTFASAAFGSTYTANPGTYYVGFVWNRTAVTVSPSIGQFATIGGMNQNYTFDYTNSSKTVCYFDGIVTTAAPTSLAMSSATSTLSVLPFVSLY